MAGSITPEQARAELARRRAAKSPSGSVPTSTGGITPEMARAELARRRGGSADVAPPTTPPSAEEKGWLRTIDDGVRGIADMLTFGLADEISAKAGEVTGIGSAGGDYATNVAAERKRDAEGGAAPVAGQLAGAVMMPGGAAKTTLGAIRNGAVAGAAYGFGSGEGGITDRRDGAIAGGLLGGAAGGALQGAANMLTTKAARATIPTNEALRSAGNAAYKEAEDLGVIIRPESGQRLTNTVTEDLANFGYDQALHPGVGAVISRLNDLGQSNTTLKGLEIVRKVARSAAADFNNPEQQKLAGKIIDHIDDYVGNLSTSDVLTGNAKEAGNAMLKARSLWSKLRKSEAVDTATMKAERRAASTGSGGNLDNALRQNVRGLLDKPRTAAGMSASEKKMAERVVRGGFLQNRARDLGKLAPTGIVSGGIGTSMGAGLGSFIGGPAGASVGAVALPAFGQFMKMVADRTTVKNAERLGEIIRSGGLTAKEIAHQASLGIGQADLITATAQYRALAGQLRPGASTLAASVPDRVQ